MTRVISGTIKLATCLIPDSRAEQLLVSTDIMISRSTQFRSRTRVLCFAHHPPHLLNIFLWEIKPQRCSNTNYSFLLNIKRLVSKGEHETDWIHLWKDRVSEDTEFSLTFATETALGSLAKSLHFSAPRFPLTKVSPTCLLEAQISPFIQNSCPVSEGLQRLGGSNTFEVFRTLKPQVVNL